MVGRNYTYQTNTGMTLFLTDKLLNPFIGAGALGMTVDEFNGDNFDHGPLGFVGGGNAALIVTGKRPIQSHPLPPGTPRWGAAYKQALADNYQHAVGLVAQGSSSAKPGQLPGPRPHIYRPFRQAANALDLQLSRQ